MTAAVAGSAPPRRGRMIRRCAAKTPDEVVEPLLSKGADDALSAADRGELQVREVLLQVVRRRCRCPVFLVILGHPRWRPGRCQLAIGNNLMFSIALPMPSSQTRRLWHC